MLTQYRRLLLNLKSLTTFRSVIGLPAMQALTDLLKALDQCPEETVQAYGKLLYEVREAGFSDLSSYMEDHLRYDESAFGRACAQGTNDALFTDAARKDVESLNGAATLDFDALKACMAERFPEYAEAFIFLLQVLIFSPLSL